MVSDGAAARCVERPRSAQLVLRREQRHAILNKARIRRVIRHRGAAPRRRLRRRERRRFAVAWRNVAVGADVAVVLRNAARVGDALARESVAPRRRCDATLEIGVRQAVFRIIPWNAVARGVDRPVIGALHIPLLDDLPRLNCDGVVRSHRRKEQHVLAEMNRSGKFVHRVRHLLIEGRLVLACGHQRIVSELPGGMFALVEVVRTRLVFLIVGDSETAGAGAQQIFLRQIIGVARQEQVVVGESAPRDCEKIRLRRLSVIRVQNVERRSEQNLDIRGVRHVGVGVQPNPKPNRIRALLRRPRDSAPIAANGIRRGIRQNRDMHRRRLGQTQTFLQHVLHSGRAIDNAGKGRYAPGAPRRVGV